MENPASWGETNKLIGQGLHLITSNGETPGRSVVNLLQSKGVLKENTPVVLNALEYIINAEHAEHQKLVATGFCGRSLNSKLETILSMLGAI